MMQTLSPCDEMSAGLSAELAAAKHLDNYRRQACCTQCRVEGSVRGASLRRFDPREDFNPGPARGA
jgi:hypothetical protein